MAPKRIAFLGATGGCTLAALTHTILSAGKYHSTALVRTPTKLAALLLAQPGMTQELIDSHLTIVTGDARSASDLAKLLTPPVDVIITGLGAAPKFQASLFTPVSLDNPNICEEAAKALVEVVSTAGVKPLLAFVSTTGLSQTEDVPFAFRFLYHVLLKVPHQDKKLMERAFTDATCFRGVVGARASLLTGTGKISEEVGNVRVGEEETPAIGYTVGRAEVGRWLFNELIEGEGNGWAGKRVTLTY